MFMMVVSEEFLATLTVCGLSVRKSSNQLYSGVLMPIAPSLFVRCWGMTVLKAELKSMNSVHQNCLCFPDEPGVGGVLLL